MSKEEPEESGVGWGLEPAKDAVEGEVPVVMRMGDLSQPKKPESEEA